jgi:hypothetical protein
MEPAPNPQATLVLNGGRLTPQNTTQKYRHKYKNWIKYSLEVGNKTMACTLDEAADDVGY